MIKSAAHSVVQIGGNVQIVLLGENEQVIDWQVCKNRVVENGLSRLASSMQGQGFTVPEIALGTGDGDTTGMMMALEAEVLREAITQTTYGLTSNEYRFYLSRNQLNGTTIEEAALLDEDGNLFARVLTGGIEKTNAVAVIFTWTIPFSPNL